MPLDIRYRLRQVTDSNVDQCTFVIRTRRMIALVAFASAASLTPDFPKIVVLPNQMIANKKGESEDSPLYTLCASVNENSDTEGLRHNAFMHIQRPITHITHRRRACCNIASIAFLSNQIPFVMTALGRRSSDKSSNGSPSIRIMSAA